MRRIFFPALCAVTLGSLGCGGSDAAGDLPECVGGEPAAGDVVAGVYSVPVSADLEPYASYPIDAVETCRTATGMHLGYALPALLVGKKEHVTFEGSLDAASGRYVLSGAEGTATCTPGDTWLCVEQFTGLEHDLGAVAEETEGLPPDEAKGKQDVAKTFSVDPIGELRFTAP